MHEVSIRKCGLITQTLCRVTKDIVELQVCEGLPDFFEFLVEFEDKVLEPHRFLALDEALKATLAHWWETHKKLITAKLSLAQPIPNSVGYELPLSTTSITLKSA